MDQCRNRKVEILSLRDGDTFANKLLIIIEENEGLVTLPPEISAMSQPAKTSNGPLTWTEELLLRTWWLRSFISKQTMNCMISGVGEKTCQPPKVGLQKKQHKIGAVAFLCPPFWFKGFITIHPWNVESGPRTACKLRVFGSTNSIRLFSWTKHRRAPSCSMARVWAEL